MNLAFMLSSAALAVSVVVSAVKFLDWWLHTDPRTMIRTGRRVLVVLAIAAIPTLVILLVYEMWVPAMLLGTGTLAAATALNWQRLLALRPAPDERQRDPRGARFRPAWRDAPPPQAPRPPRLDDRDEAIAARAADVLEAYLEHVRGGEEADRQARRPRAVRSGTTMSRREALDVLGLPPDANTAAINAAHRRLLQMTHPDRGGSNWLAAKVNEAKAVLTGDRPRRRGATGPRAASPE